MRLLPWALLSLAGLCSCSGASSPPRTLPVGSASASSRSLTASSPPRPLAVPTPREPVLDKLHGVTIEDPYRWLEDGSSGRVRTWTQAQNALTRSFLDGLSGRDELRASIQKYMRVGWVEAPEPRQLASGSWRYFYVRRQGSQNQPVLYMRDGLEGPERIALDVNQLDADGEVALDWFFPSSDGRLIAYGTSLHGDEDSVLRLLEIKPDGTAVQRKESIPDTRHCSLSWAPDNRSFFYTRYPAKGQVPSGEELYHRGVYLHRLGTDWRKDPKVFGEGRDMTDSPSVDLSPNGRWLVIQVHEGWAKTELYLRDNSEVHSRLVPVAVGRSSTYEARVLDDRLYVQTDDEAPRGRLISIDPLHPQRENWKTILPQTQDTLDEFAITRSELVVSYMHNVSARVQRYSKQGEFKADVALPTLGTVHLGADPRSEELFVRFRSFANPSEVMRVGLGPDDAGQSKTWARIDSPLDPQSVLVEQYWAASKDGTPIPYFAIRRKDLPKDRPLAGLLAAYGGFKISLLPSYLRSASVIVERGGVYLVANLRGGGEFGEAWHRAGMLASKQNVFDDLYAVAQDAKHRGLVVPERLALMGASNGGLLAGVALTQHPEMFRAVVAKVPLFDMLRYQHFLIAKLWIPEYGSAEQPELFPVLYGYSPYHHVKKGVAYPATLLAAAESDSRVDPLHARKMAAALQYATSSSEPILLRIETQAGHGAGKPLTKQVEEDVDIYSFLLAKLGLGSDARD